MTKQQDTDSEEPASLWHATAGEPARFAALEHNVDTEFAVIGGGYTGLHAAHALSELGRPAVVIEARQPGWGASGRNGGQVIPGLHVGPAALARRYGRDRGERWLRHALTSADALFRVIADQGIECDQSQAGHLKLAHAPWALDRLAERAEVLAPFGARMSMLDRRETEHLCGSSAYCGGRLTENGGTVHPLKLARSLARTAAASGVQIFGHTPAIRIGRIDGGWRIDTPRGSVAARGLIIATNTYTGSLHRAVRRGLVRVCSFQAATRPLGDRGREILRDGQAASDTRRLLHYFRMDPDGRLIMGGRAPFRHDVTLADAGSLRRGVEMIYPSLRDEPFELCWGGWVGMTPQDLPVLARLAPGAYAVYGFNGTGVALSCVMGRAVAQLAAGTDEDRIDVPVEKAVGVPLHELSGLGARAWIAGLGLMDRLGI